MLCLHDHFVFPSEAAGTTGFRTSMIDEQALQAHAGAVASSEQVEPQRSRQRRGTYMCSYIDCDQHFKRHCDLKKHERRKHGSMQSRKHACELWERRFIYPKDLIRHAKARHPATTEEIAYTQRLCQGRTMSVIDAMDGAHAAHAGAGSRGPGHGTRPSSRPGNSRPRKPPQPRDGGHDPVCWICCRQFRSMHGSVRHHKLHRHAKGRHSETAEEIVYPQRLCQGRAMDVMTNVARAADPIPRPGHGARPRPRSGRPMRCKLPQPRDDGLSWRSDGYDSVRWVCRERMSSIAFFGPPPGALGQCSDLRVAIRADRDSTARIIASDDLLRCRALWVCIWECPRSVGFIPVLVLDSWSCRPHRRPQPHQRCYTRTSRSVRTRVCGLSRSRQQLALLSGTLRARDTVPEEK